jgi:hypothetical protein
MVTVVAVRRYKSLLFRFFQIRILAVDLPV